MLPGVNIMVNHQLNIYLSRDIHNAQTALYVREPKDTCTSSDINFQADTNPNAEGAVYFVNQDSCNFPVTDVSTKAKAKSEFGDSPNDPAFVARKNAVTHEEVVLTPPPAGVEVDLVQRVIQRPKTNTTTMASTTTLRNKEVVTTRKNVHGDYRTTKTSVGSHIADHAVKGPSVHCSATSGICDIVDRWGTKGYAEVQPPSASAGVVTTKTRKIASAHAGVITSCAGTPHGIASVHASLLTASATASYGFDGVSAFANASLASVGVQAGPVNASVGVNLTTGVHLGTLGVIEASILGFGFSIGPKIGFSTPFCSISFGL
jgi:hypothetical protein